MKNDGKSLVNENSLPIDERTFGGLSGLSGDLCGNLFQFIGQIAVYAIIVSNGMKFNKLNVSKFITQTKKIYVLIKMYIIYSKLLKKFNYFANVSLE